MFRKPRAIAPIFFFAAMLASLAAIAVLASTPMQVTLAKDQQQARRMQPITECSDPSDPFILGPTVPLTAYDSGEAVQWGYYFLVSPSKAKDRTVLYAYDIALVDSDFISKLEEQIKTGEQRLAVVASPLSKSVVLAVPLILSGQDNSSMLDFLARLRDPNTSNRYLAAVLAISWMKTSGLDLSILGDQGRPSTDRPWSIAIASSLPIITTHTPKSYITSSSAWDFCKAPHDTLVRASELRGKLRTYR